MPKHVVSLNQFIPPLLVVFDCPTAYLNWRVACLSFLFRIFFHYISYIKTPKLKYSKFCIILLCSVVLNLCLLVNCRIYVILRITARKVGWTNVVCVNCEKFSHRNRRNWLGILDINGKIILKCISEQLVWIQGDSGGICNTWEMIKCVILSKKKFIWTWVRFWTLKICYEMCQTSTSQGFVRCRSSVTHGDSPFVLRCMWCYLLRNCCSCSQDGPYLLFTVPYLGNRSKSDPCSYELFCLESHILSFPKVLQIAPESSCMWPGLMYLRVGSNGDLFLK
jgi:hypothetical protein